MIIIIIFIIIININIIIIWRHSGSILQIRLEWTDGRNSF